jgi:hypothetical protein
LSDGRPHLVVVTRDALSVGRLYIDGVLVGSLSGMTESMTNSVQLRLGGTLTSTPIYFKGVLDDLKYWARELSAPEILAMRQTFDSDNDGLPDAWELKHFNTLANSGTGDNDTGGADGLTNAQEYALRLNPTVRDTDGDGLIDGDEVTAGLNAGLTDTDGDGMADNDEIANGMNPAVAATEDTAGTYLQLTVYTPLQ